MAPDLNSLPPLPSSALPDTPRRSSLNASVNASRPSPPSPSLSSLQAAATINASLHRPPSNTSPARTSFDRRRSSLLNNLSINDPTTPAPGEFQHSNASSPSVSRRFSGGPIDIPSHGRQVSLGELHQELENEQEAQVNRLLHMIRLQQDQLAAVSRTRSGSSQEDQSPTSEFAVLPTPPASQPATTPNAESPRASTASHSQHYYRPHSLSRRSPTRLSVHGSTSRGSSPALRPISASLGPLTEDFLLGGTRDECAFYQAETQMLTRENQMLKHRIRELERQVAEHASNNTPTNLSPLAGPPALLTDAANEASTAATV